MSKGTIQDEALRLSREHRDRLTSMGHDAALRAAIAIGIRYGRNHPEGDEGPVMVPRMKLGRILDGEALDGAGRAADIPRDDRPEANERRRAAQATGQPAGE